MTGNNEAARAALDQARAEVGIWARRHAELRAVTCQLVTEVIRCGGHRQAVSAAEAALALPRPRGVAAMGGRLDDVAAYRRVRDAWARCNGDLHVVCNALFRAVEEAGGDMEVVYRATLVLSCAPQLQPPQGCALPGAQAA